MKPIRLTLLCAALPLALCACAGPRAAAPQTVTLAPGEHADIGNGDTLTYDSYSDSRCPRGVWCVWSGELVYRFTVATPRASESFAVTLPNTSHVSTALAGARIALDPARVPPPPHEGSAPAQYSVTLTVSRP
ncbi:MAG: hypothetical protein ACXWC4_14120 [Telluria sp.]